MKNKKALITIITCLAIVVIALLIWHPWSKPVDLSHTTADPGNFHIGIVTGSASQGEDDIRGAEAFQTKIGADRVKLAVYPDNFTEE